METSFGQLTYCSNIHSGESWKEHFLSLQNSVPEIKSSISSLSAMGLGLRLSNQASVDLLEKTNIDNFKIWLDNNGIYIFTINGFPYGNFHDVVVKDNVHFPDWTSLERKDYTIRLFYLLSELIPKHIYEGGISTSPLSYRFWWNTPYLLESAIKKSTENILLVLDVLIELFEKTGKTFHLDIEPEPDGIIENSNEFIDWYNNFLIPMGTEHLKNKNFSDEEAIIAIKRHIQLCYDVCHFAIGFETPNVVIEKLYKEGIKVGKIQISAALKINFENDFEAKLSEIKKYEEPTYLHQVVVQNKDRTFQKFQDLDQAIKGFNENVSSWRVHFHVPIFLDQYGKLESTQSDIIETIKLQKQQLFTNHLEIETYTWGVLPNEFKDTLNNSIIRELNWVKNLL